MRSWLRLHTASPAAPCTHPDESLVAELRRSSSAYARDGFEGPSQAVPAPCSSTLHPPSLLHSPSPNNPHPQLAPSMQDPFALLLQLLAALLTRPGAAQPSNSLVCSAHTQPAALLQALLAVLYPAAAGQALALALGGGAATTAEAVAAMAGSPPLASAVEGAVSAALVPWLQRGALLLALLQGQPAPAAPTGMPGSAVAAAAALLQRLRLPPLPAALRQPAASGLRPAAAQPIGMPGHLGTQLSVRVAGRLWEVAARPLPVAAQLLQLPTSFQVRGFALLADNDLSGLRLGWLPSLHAPASRASAPVVMPAALLQVASKLPPLALLRPLTQISTATPHPLTSPSPSPTFQHACQAWYLSMGSHPCSACGQQPSEPALCLRCGAVVCCGSRRCHGPAQQGMCYTHAAACGGGTCAFLLLKMTRLLVIRKNRFWGEGTSVKPATFLVALPGLGSAPWLHRLPAGSPRFRTQCSCLHRRTANVRWPPSSLPGCRPGPSRPLALSALRHRVAASLVQHRPVPPARHMYV